ncbi:MAG TPA: hypothetical protein ENL41_00250 [candidate division WOR-3 bacterium]|uniref:Uncharacterized protein n=1 Tax=candidate division WOR-3 bacterium TaxID=2052148 RepID=A0A7C5I1H7_UNCW3|nr:hypothetical protein [candidate division WOR-3 bacterium]
MRLKKLPKSLCLGLIIAVIAMSLVVLVQTKLPAQETHQETQETQKTIEVIGVIKVVGQGPLETGLVIKPSDGPGYAIVGERASELWELQGKKIRAIGIEGGPTLVCTRSLEIISYEILDY